MKTINDNQNKEVIIICELSVNDDRTIDTREWSDSYAKLISETRGEHYLLEVFDF